MTTKLPGRTITTRRFVLMPLSLLFYASCLFAQGTARARAFRLTATTPDFWKPIDQDAKLERLATGFGFIEGPVWDKAGFAWVSDEVLYKIYRVRADGSRQEVISIVDPDGNTYDGDHRLVDCASVIRGIIRLSADGKSYKVLADKWRGKRFNSPNDVVLGPDGAFYSTAPTLDLVKGETQEISFQGVYRLDTKGNVNLLTKELTQPNGLAFSPDGKRFYVDDSEQSNICVCHFHANGTIADGRILASEKPGPEDGVPDGIRVDVRGTLFVTRPQGIWI